MSWETVKIGKVLKQYRIEHWVQNDKMYKQVSILNDGSVILRGEKIGKEIGRKRQFIIDLDKYPDTLIFTRQLLLQGSIGIASAEVNKCIVTENMPMFSIEGINPHFLMFFIESDLFKRQVRNLKTSGTAQKSLHERQFLELNIPLPSEKEQEEIIGRCRFLQKSTRKTIEEIDRQQTYLQQLRESILQEAVQGKLSEQNSSDEDAAGLLKRIKAEKEKLIKEGKLKKDKELPPIREDEIPFELPRGWVWCRLKELCNYIVDCPHSTPKFEEEGFNCIDTTSMEQGEILIDKIRKVSEATFHVRNLRLIPEVRDIIFSREGTVGMAVILPEDFPVCLGQRVLLFRTSSLVLPEYFRFSIVSPMFVKQWESGHKGAASKHVNIGDLKKYLIPLPPFSEQQRIVAKAEKLQQQLTELESQVQQSREYANRLLQSVLKEAFEEKAKLYDVEEERVWIVAEQ